MLTVQMSPKQSRAGKMEQSVITTRARAQRLKVENKNTTKSSENRQRSHKREKSLDAKDILEKNVRYSSRKKSPNIKTTLSTSVRKKVSYRNLKLADEMELENKCVIHESRDIKTNKSKKVLKDKHNNNISTTENSLQNLSGLSDLQDINPDDTVKKQQKQIVIKAVRISPNIITPKSTPIKLNLTPHRSSKTPKKSPISLSSPKTHTVATPKLLKTPRKLSLSSASEEILGDILNNSYNKKGQKRKRNSTDNLSISKQAISPSPVKTKHKRSVKNLKEIVRRFSKSPKIVLRTPKSKKTKSPKLKFLSPTQAKRNSIKSTLITTTTGITSNLNTMKSVKMNTEETSIAKHKNMLTVKHGLLDLQAKNLLAEPIVLLERLSSEKIKTILTSGNKTHPNTLIKIESNTGNNHKVVTSITEKAISGLNKSANLRNTPNNTGVNLMNNRKKKLSPNKNITNITNIPNISEKTKSKSLISLVSSTPQKEKIALIDMNLTFNTPIVCIDNIFPNTRSRNKNQLDLCTTQLSRVIDKNTSIENISQPSLLNEYFSNISQNHISNISKLNNTCDINEAIITKIKDQQESKKNNTYELEQPETPALRRMIRKRTSTDADLSLKKDIKKARKVRFTTFTPDQNRHSSINKSSNLWSNLSRTDTVQRNMNSMHKSAKIEIPKFNRNLSTVSFNTNVKSSPMTNGITLRAQQNKKSHNINNTISNSTINKTPNTPKVSLTTEKQSGKKSSVKKKLPNFGKIHERLFAKAESVVDAKKRLEDRHLAFTANKTLPKTEAKLELRPLPTDTADGTHNRFGFKLRKAEATHVMLKKQLVFSRQKKQHETRMILQGVRMNRRFELQMKARNINV